MKTKMTLEMKHSKVFVKNHKALDNKDIRFIINQGGSRAGKTYSLIQLMIVYCLVHPGILISIVRKSFPSLRGSVMRDFMEIMRDLGIYKLNEHHKTEHMYNFSNGSSIEFFSVDNEQKLRGRKRDILWANEANELNFEEFQQLNMRTSSKMIFDYNPSNNYHWLYDLITRDESVLIHSTYLDNPFLEQSLVKEIENLKNVDEGYYRIYSLGERGVLKSTIYTTWKYYEDEPTNYKDTVYGLDFGFNHPSCLIEVKYDDDNTWVKELMYKSNMTAQDMVQELDRLEINKSKEIICDSARPEVIEDLKRAGYNAKGAIKNVKEGIDSVKTCNLHIHKSSINLLKEISNYQWKTKDDMILDEPVKVWDDACDSMRYAVHWIKKKNIRQNPDFFKFY